MPLVVVGSVPYPSDHERTVHTIAATDPRIRMLGGVWDQDLLNALYAGSASYLHGHSVGGTNPSLLRAMGAGAPVIAWEVNFNREVLGETGRFFATASDLADLVEEAEKDPAAAHDLGEGGRLRAAQLYRWDNVAIGYEQLCQDLLARAVPRGRGSSTQAGTATAPASADPAAPQSNSIPPPDKETIPEPAESARSGPRKPTDAR